MSSMDPTRVDSSILSETMRRTSLQPFRLHQLLNTKSSSLTRQITQQTMYNSSYGRLLRNLVATADLSSPATSKTESSNHSTPGARVLIFPPIEKTDQDLRSNSSNASRESWLRKTLNLITRSW